MKSFAATAAIAALYFALTAAECPNACSGNGECSTNHDFCVCYSGFTGADCSQRVCPFGLAWIDTPVGDLDHDNLLTSGGVDFTGIRAAGTPGSRSLNPDWAPKGYWERHPSQLWGELGASDTNTETGLPFYVRHDEAHFPMECSNRGICDRSTGLCDCFTGFGGAACNRTVCVNDCSGHGTCESINELTPDNIYYNLWDADKIFQCKCDGGYTGQDCSQRVCANNDDPLTETGTIREYNEGLAERGEVQEVVVRCPYNGELYNPVIRMVYTDELGDEYSTGDIDLSDATEDEITAMLKGLPNQVLADYVVDGVLQQSKLHPTNAVTKTVLKADYAYKLTVRFHKSMGNVAAFKIRSFATCRNSFSFKATSGNNGTDLILNAKAATTGNGPSEYFRAVINITEPGIPINGNVTYFDQHNNVLGSQYFWDGLTHDSAKALPSADLLVHHDAQFVAFTIDDGNSADSATFPAEGDSLQIEYFPDAIASVNVQLSRPRGVSNWQATKINANGTEHDVDVGVVVTLGTALGDAHRSQNMELRALDGSNFLLTVDGEALGVYDNTFAPIGGASFERCGYLCADYGLDVSVGDATINAGDRYVFSTDRTGIDGVVYYSTQGSEYISDSVQIRARDANVGGPRVPLTLVFQVMDVSGSMDKYRWKVSGDPIWQNNGGAYYSLNDSFATLDTDSWMRNSTVLEAQTMGQELKKIEFKFSNGADHDKRICGAATNAAESYRIVQIGENGVNDRPVCSGRGLCDGATGQCKCFKGYADMDCRLQNALSMGSSTASINSL